jgi:hypothetical protein
MRLCAADSSGASARKDNSLRADFLRWSFARHRAAIASAETKFLGDYALRQARSHPARRPALL